MKQQTYVNAFGYEVAKIVKPYGKAPKENKKFKKEKRIKHVSIRDLA